MPTGDLGKVEVGDRLLEVTETERNRLPKREPVLRWMTVSKVGREYGEAHPEGEKATKWSTRRFRLDTGHMPGAGGGFQTVRLFRSEEEWRQRERDEAAWNALKRSIGHSRPPGVTEAAIKEAAKLLNLTPDWNRQ